MTWPLECSQRLADGRVGGVPGSWPAADGGYFAYTNARAWHGKGPTVVVRPPVAASAVRENAVKATDHMAQMHVLHKMMHREGQKIVLQHHRIAGAGAGDLDRGLGIGQPVQPAAR